LNVTLSPSHPLLAATLRTSKSPSPVTTLHLNIDPDNEPPSTNSSLNAVATSAVSFPEETAGHTLL